MMSMIVIFLGVKNLYVYIIPGFRLMQALFNLELNCRI